MTDIEIIVIFMEMIVKNMKPFFSFIVPVYKVEQYLRQCVDSILSQEYKNFELILVDDGSPDNSGKICDEYAKNHENVFTFHKENGGLSDARNYGLSKATGEYILFVDSDDFIFENSLTEIAKICQKSSADLVFLKGFKFYENNSSLDELDQDIHIDDFNSKDKILKYLSSLNKFPGSACTKAIKREFLIKNNLVFLKGLLSEDIDWMIRVLKKMSSCTSINVPYYCYRQNRLNSISNSISAKNINSILKIISTHAILDVTNKEDEYINNFLAYEYMILIANYASLTKEEKNKVASDVYEYKWLLKYKNNSKVKLTYIIKNIVGIKLTSKLLYCYLKHR